MEDNRSLLERLNEKEEAESLDKAEAKKDDIKEDKTSSTKSAKKKNTDNAEKVIWGACGFLGAIFLIMLIVFISRTAGAKKADKDPIDLGNNTVTTSQTGSGNSEVTGQTGNNSSQGEQNGNIVSSEKGQPVVFTSNASQSKEGDWLFVEGNQIVDREGKPVWLTGVNWFGYNTGTNTFDGLWACDLNSSIDAIADHGFNLLRIPISTELLLQWKNGEYPTANFNQATNDYLVGMNSLEIFNYVLDRCEQNGIKVMLDVHCAKTDASGHTVNLWTNGDITEQDFIDAWVWVAETYKDNDTIIAFDLENEPHGKPFEEEKAIWNDSTDSNNWKYVAETAANKVLAKNPNLLIMIEGTEIYSKKNGSYSSTNDSDYYFNWWGGNLRGVKDYPINLGKNQDKIVYSPHDYGPKVYEQPWFKGNFTYDSLMKDCWKDNWLYIHTSGTAPLLIGEWGGFMDGGSNEKWMGYMRQLISTYHLNHTFWCLNANSGDTGGLLTDNFKDWDTKKYNFVKQVLWQQNGKFVGLDHQKALGANGISLSQAKSL